MPSSTAGALVPARFLTTTGHLLVTIMVFMTKDTNVRASLPLSDWSNFSAYNASLTAALALTWVCVAIEFGGLFFGISMFHSQANVLYTTAHLVAIILCCLYITQAWYYSAYWYIFGFCSALPAVLESVIVTRSVVLHVD